MKNILWLFVGFAVAYYFVMQKYGSLQTALAAWSPTVQTVVSTSQPALASNGQGSGSLAPESSFYASSLPNAYYPIPPGSGNNAASVGAGHVNPVNFVRPSSPVGGPGRVVNHTGAIRAIAPGGKSLPVTPIATGRQFVTTAHSPVPAKLYQHNVVGPIGTGNIGHA